MHSVLARLHIFGNAFAYAADSAHLTHGHPSGYLAAGLFVDILQRLVGNENSLEHAIKAIERDYPTGSEPTVPQSRQPWHIKIGGL
ncbi:ADP-ribosylglycohydrolase family protein [Pseudomonas japonica]|uniref:ADP-ribosylglycohydrolase family protein n=1 Tax=Pseudomonas japonica TaxID=256466 RepID=UPI0035C1C05E